MNPIDDSIDAGSDLPVLAINAGSSSLKLGVYQVNASAATLLLSAALDEGGDAPGELRAWDASGNTIAAAQPVGRDPRRTLVCIQQLIRDCGLPSPSAIGHRIVHGGIHVRRHCLVDATVLEQLQQAIAFAPLHVPPALALLRAAQEYFPSVPQVACVDTAFHANLPDVARTLPLPAACRALGIQRYGFHGLSCESIVRQLGADLPARMVIAHLGNGASVTAVDQGRSVDTSMGLTPSGGVIMGTRCGDLDPGVLVYLLREQRFGAAQLENLIDHQGGLLGISGISGDMRRLHATSAQNADARLAIEMFCLSVRKQVAAMAAVLGGIELLVFSGGIGEHDAQVRDAICSGLSWLGISTANDAASNCQVRVLPAREEQQIALLTWRISCAAKQFD